MQVWLKLHLSNFLLGFNQLHHLQDCGWAALLSKVGGCITSFVVLKGLAGRGRRCPGAKLLHRQHRCNAGQHLALCILGTEYQATRYMPIEIMDPSQLFLLDGGGIPQR